MNFLHFIDNENNQYDTAKFDAYQVYGEDFDDIVLTAQIVNNKIVVTSVGNTGLLDNLTVGNVDSDINAIIRRTLVRWASAYDYVDFFDDNRNALTLVADEQSTYTKMVTSDKNKKNIKKFKNKF